MDYHEVRDHAEQERFSEVGHWSAQNSSFQICQRSGGITSLWRASHGSELGFNNRRSKLCYAGINVTGHGYNNASEHGRQGVDGHD
jgi:hypothetical protein